MYQAFVGTDAEFHKVVLPPTTQECIDARPQSVDELCSDNLEDRVGDAEGACEYKPVSLAKIIAAGLYDAVYDSSIPEGVRSPAYDVLRRFQISELQIGQLFEYTRNHSSDREGVCAWVADNFNETLNTTNFVPGSYPRVLKDEDKAVFPYVATSLGCLVTLLVLLTIWRVYSNKHKPAIRFAQVEFLLLLLSGSLTIAIGAIVVSVPPTNRTCLAGIWLINLGYTFELVPLIVKVAAINKMMMAAESMRRVVLKRRKLYGAVAFVSLTIIVFLIVWSVVDPPRRAPEYVLSDNLSEDGDTIVYVSYYCDGESDAWQFAAVGWNALLLLAASVLAFQSRKVRSDFNETNTLAFMIYSHFMFVVLRVTTLLVAGTVTVEETTLQRLRSLIYSVDTTATILIYFIPKLFAGTDDNWNGTWPSSRFLTFPVGSRLAWMIPSRFSAVEGSSHEHTSGSGSGAKTSASLEQDAAHSFSTKPSWKREAGSGIYTQPSTSMGLQPELAEGSMNGSNEHTEKIEFEEPTA